VAQSRQLSGACVLVVAGMVLAGCSPGGDAGPAASSPPATTAPPPTRAPLELPAGYAGHRSEVYADKAHWVCRPDTQDTCDVSLDATSVAADGTLTRVAIAPAADPPVDCFYVYPTISRDPGANSDLSAAPEQEGVAAAGQVAQLAPRCRVFAPTYRQVTVSAVRTMVGGGVVAEADRALAYNDVVDAWKHYLANDNGGRGVVLVGHSQGAGVLAGLIKTEIDPRPELRRFLVSAFLAGTAVRVPDGADVGGDFANVPLCRRADQVGCVVSWASFPAEPGAPDNARFGKVSNGPGVAGCVNPAAPAGGRVPLRNFFGATPGRSRQALGGDPGAARWVDPAKGEITTSYATLPGLFEGECVTRNGATYLAVTVNGDPADPRADGLDGGAPPDWGLHLYDVNLVMGDMVDLVGRQTAAFTGQEQDR
jgi:hypothetical protein